MARRRAIIRGPEEGDVGWMKTALGQLLISAPNCSRPRAAALVDFGREPDKGPEMIGNFRGQ